MPKMPQTAEVGVKEKLLMTLQSMIGEDSYRAMASIVLYSDESVHLVTHGCPDPSMEHGMLSAAIEIFQKRCKEIRVATMSHRHGPSN